MLITVAAFQILEGIAAIAEDTVFVTGHQVHLRVRRDHLGMDSPRPRHRRASPSVSASWPARPGACSVGVVIAAIGALSSFAFMPYYPFWAIAVIAFNVFVIWALCSEVVRD